MDRHLPTEEPQQSKTVERLLQPAAGRGMPAKLVPPDLLGARGTGVDPLWTWGVAGLMLLATVALAGLIYLIADGKPGTRPELALTAFVGLLSTLLGVLMGAPWHGSPL